MKKTITIFFIFLILFGCKEHDSGKPIVVASATKMKVLYIGINNPISVAVSGIPSNKIKLKVDDSTGSIKGDSGKYIASVKSSSYKIKVYKIEDDKETFIDTLKFRIKSVPLPHSSIAGYTGDCEMTKEELLNVDKISAEIPDFIFDLKFPIVSFKLSVSINGLFIEADSNGAEITEEMKNLIKHTLSGGRVLIENVFVNSPEGKKHIYGISIKVK